MSAGGDFWSRRKAAVAKEAEPVVAEPAAETEIVDERSDAEILEALELQDPDTLEMGDDFSGFMAKAVPEHLRRKALRKLWLSNPTLANLDALVEYGEDYTDAATVVENLQTAYQVGKGMMRHVEEMARVAAADDEEAPAAEEAAVEMVEAAVEAEPENTEALFADAAEAPIPQDDPEEPPRARRHMRFSFESQYSERAL